jgi:hypothetical protein
MKTRKRFKPRKVNLEPVRLKNGKFIYAGDSQFTVPCPNCIAKGMRQNLRRTAIKSRTATSAIRKIALELMAEYKIPLRRVKNKRRAA